MSDTVSRRSVVIAGAAVGAGAVIAGCSTGPPAAPAAAPSTAGTVLGPATDVPVGSAKIFSAQKVVVTQATAGTYAGFSTTCPHAGCAVASVADGRITCPCHGSTFALDGSVVQGPAARGLSPQAVTVANGQVTLA